MSSTCSVPSSTNETAPTWMPIIFFDSPGKAIAGIASAAPAPAVSFTNSRRFRSGLSTEKSSPKIWQTWVTLNRPTLHRLAQILSQRQAAVIVELLVACPAYRIAHPFHFNLSAKLQPFELRTLRQD